jgi:hypothetical protein
VRSGRMTLTVNSSPRRGGTTVTCQQPLKSAAAARDDWSNSRHCYQALAVTV